MTLFHFGNCLALVYIPFHLTYKYSGLSEYRAFWKCVSAGGIYVFTQLCKMMILATFFSTSESNIHGRVDLLAEVYKATIEVGDIVGLYVALRGIPGKGRAKLLTAALGWAGAELLLTRAWMLWVGARGAQFDWIFLQKSLESNVNLVQHTVTTALVWLWSRHNIGQATTIMTGTLLLLCAYRPIILETLLAHFGATAPLVPLGASALYTMVLGIASLRLYAVYSAANDK